MAYPSPEIEAAFAAAQRNDAKALKKALALSRLPPRAALDAASGDTLLHVACRAGAKRAAKAVLRACAYDTDPPDLTYIDLRNASGDDALALATAAGHDMLAEWLRALGARAGGMGAPGAGELSSDAPHAPSSYRQRHRHRHTPASTHLGLQQRQQQQQQQRRQQQQQQQQQQTLLLQQGHAFNVPLYTGGLTGTQLPAPAAQPWLAAAAAHAQAEMSAARYSHEHERSEHLRREVDALRTELGAAADAAASAERAAMDRAAAQAQAENTLAAERERVAGDRTKERAAVLEGLGLAEARALRLARLNASIRARYDGMRRAALSAVGRTRLLARELRAERARRDDDARAARAARVEAEDSAYSAGYMDGYKEGLAAAERKARLGAPAAGAAATVGASDAPAEKGQRGSVARNPLAGAEAETSLDGLDGQGSLGDALLTDRELAPTLELGGVSEETGSAGDARAVGDALSALRLGGGAAPSGPLRPPRRAVAGERVAIQVAPATQRGSTPFTSYGSERLQEAEAAAAGASGGLGGLATRAAEAAKAYIAPLIKSAAELARIPPAGAADAAELAREADGWAEEMDAWLEDEDAAANEDFDAIEKGRDMDEQLDQAKRLADDAAERAMGAHAGGAKAGH